MKDFMNWFTEEESGQGMVEYGLIIALVAVVVIAALTLLGKGIDKQFKSINKELK
ncbi:Flp family type IVb pilin [Bulleidia extructa]